MRRLRSGGREQQQVLATPSPSSRARGDAWVSHPADSLPPKRPTTQSDTCVSQERVSDHQKMPTVTAADLLRARSSGSVHSLGEDSLSSLQPKDRQRHRLTRHHETTVIVMVGLPARGKSFISKKVERFLSWRGDQVKIFNVGDRRRKHSSAQESKHDAAFFSKETAHVREEIAHGVLMEMIHWLMTGEDVPSPNSRAAAPTAPAAAAPATPKPLAAPGSVDISDAAKATTTPRAERTAGFGMPLNTSVEPRRPGIARAESEEEREPLRCRVRRAPRFLTRRTQQRSAESLCRRPGARAALLPCRIRRVDPRRRLGAGAQSRPEDCDEPRLSRHGRRCARRPQTAHHSL